MTPYFEALRILNAVGHFFKLGVENIPKIKLAENQIDGQSRSFAKTIYRYLP